MVVSNLVPVEAARALSELYISARGLAAKLLDSALPKSVHREEECATAIVSNLKEVKGLLIALRTQVLPQDLRTCVASIQESCIGLVGQPYWGIVERVRTHTAFDRRTYVIAGLVAALDDVEETRTKAAVLDRLAVELGTLLEGLASGALPQPALPVGAEESASSFVRQGEFWRIGFGGKLSSVKNSKGISYIARLLEQPNPPKPIPALAFFPGNDEACRLDHIPQPVLSEDAKRACQKRIAQLREDEEEARQLQDEQELRRIEDERDEIMADLKKAVGRGGRNRGLGPQSPERKAAESVRKALERARAALSDAGLVELSAHFKDAIRPEGNAYAYRPSPPAPDWQL